MSQDTPSQLPTRIKLKAPSTSMMGVDPSMILSGQKRRRTDSGLADSPSHSSTPSRSGGGMGGLKGEDSVAVAEMGKRLIQVLKGEVDGYGRQLISDFMTLPDRRLYSDYYQLIKTPMAIDLVEQKLKKGGYKSAHNLKNDLVHIFTNAKKYNQEGSGIYNDAEHLHNVIRKTYPTLLPSSHADYRPDPDAPVPEIAQHSSARKPARKVASMVDVKKRLDKVVHKKDNTGRVLADMFLELPDRVDWADYYKVIKNPMSFDIIYQKLKRKEYDSADELVADADRIFENALIFNQEDSTIAMDAKALRAYTHAQLDEFLSPPSAQQHQVPAKIKLKTTSSYDNSSSPAIKLRIQQPQPSQQEDVEMGGPEDEELPYELPSIPSPQQNLHQHPSPLALPNRSSSQTKPSANNALALAPPPMPALSTRRQSNNSSSSQPPPPQSSPSATAAPAAASAILLRPTQPTIAKPRPPPSIISTLTLRSITTTTPSSSSSSPSSPSIVRLNNDRGIKSHALSFPSSLSTFELELAFRAPLPPSTPSSPTTTEPPSAGAAQKKTYQISLLLNSTPLDPLPSSPFLSASPSADPYTLHPPTKWLVALPPPHPPSPFPTHPASWHLELSVGWKDPSSKVGENSTSGGKEELDDLGLPKGVRIGGFGGVTGKEVYQIFGTRI